MQGLKDRVQYVDRVGEIPRLAIFSCGLGNVNRGFEISSARFFRALKERDDLNVDLYCGGGYQEGRAVWNVKRDSWLESGLNRLPFLDGRHRWQLAYVLEQITFSLGLEAHSRSTQPDVVWTKEVPLAHILYEYRRLRRLSYKIIFANGGGFKPRTYSQFDFIQHLQPDAYHEACEYGIPPEKMTVLPNLVPEMVPDADRSMLRRRYGFEDSDWIVLCVAAWNSHHKRIDFLIDELAKIQDPKVKLLLCGQPEPETAKLREQAHRLLEGRATWLTLPEEKVCELTALSDVFVLPSLYEGLGAALIEAAMSGLPVVSHNHAGGRYILQDEYWLTDLSLPGALAQRLHQLRNLPPDKARLDGLQRQVRDRFGKSRVSEAFVNMVYKVLSPAPSLSVTFASGK